MWMTLTDGNASIDAVVWSTSLSKIHFKPKQEDGVIVIGKLNFWQSQAKLTINVIDIRPSISTVLRKFEIVRDLLIKDGLIDHKRRRALPNFPIAIAILTSVPSSALADMLRTAKERWPLTKVFVIPIPVQGAVARKISITLSSLSKKYKKLGIQALILARGGGSREDLMLFDDEELCRQVANFPIPIITGIGHEDDLTVVDLVADHRAATPTAAIVDLLPNRELALADCLQKKQRLLDHFTWFMRNQREIISQKLLLLKTYDPSIIFNNYKNELIKKELLLNALSPENWLKKGFCIAKNQLGELLTSIEAINDNSILNIQFKDGEVTSIVSKISSKLKN